MLENKVFLPSRFKGYEFYVCCFCASGFTLPSLSETFGAVVNEALIFGLKVLCSKYAGASSLIKQRNGVVFDPLNEQTVKEELSRFLRLLECHKKIDLTNRSSLMLYCQKAFSKEWRKLNYD